MDGGDVDPRRVVVDLVAVAELSPHAERLRSRKPPCSSYDEVTTASASRRARSPRPAAAASAIGRREEALDPGEPVGREREGPRGVTPADGAPGARGEAGEALSSTALDARRDVREVAREPEELELEREAERVELGPAWDRRAPARRRGGRGSAPAPRTPWRSPRARRTAAASPRRRSARRRAGSGSSRVSWCEAIRSTPVTVCSSPEPSCRTSSTCESGSRRAPKRDFVFRIPFAIAPIRPRSRV